MKDELAPLGKAILRGTYKNIAAAAMKSPHVQKEIVEIVLKKISSQCSGISSSKHPSLLRKTDVEDMRTFSLQEICKELKERAPLLYSVLLACSVAKGSINMEKDWLPSVAIAGGILLKQRCRYMTSVQLMLSILVKHCGFQASNFLHYLQCTTDHYMSNLEQ